MPSTINCPQCQRLLKVPDGMAGMQVRCPNCQYTMRISGEPAPGVPARSEPAPGWGDAASAPPTPHGDWRWMTALRREAIPYHPQWETVRAGLLVMFVGVAMLLFVNLISAFTGMLSPHPEDDPFSPISLVLGCFVLIAVLAIVVGECLCLFAPAAAGTRGWAWAMLGCQGLAVVLGVFAVMALLAAGFDPDTLNPHRLERMGDDVLAGLLVAALFFLGTLLFAWLSCLFFLVFLRGVARYFRATTAADNALYLLITVATAPLWLCACVCLLGVLTAPAAPPGPGENPLARALGTLLGIVVNLALSVWFLVALHMARNAIRPDQQDDLGY